MKRIYLLFSLLVGCIYSYAAIYNVKDFGAKADGKTIDSPAINSAIEAAAQAGGGTVYLPAGEYACYSIRLKSNIHLYLEQGARIVAAFPGKEEGYDTAEPNEHNKYQDFGHSHWKNSLIWGIGLENITISGSGLIYGKGLTREESRLPGVGNKAISLKDCRNVTLKDLSMLHCGHFALLATGVDHLTILNLKVDTNRDGFDIDCCRNVRISQCTVNSPWDDAIVLKASYGLGRFQDTENVTISDCYVSGFDQGSVMNGTWQLDEPQAPDHGYRTGRIKFGTESSGGFRNIAITNCIFEHCRGLALETVDGGRLEDIVISNITMRNIVNAPIFLRLGARMRSPEGTPVGTMKRILIRTSTSGMPTAGMLPSSAACRALASRTSLSVISTYIIKVDTAQKTASVFRPNRRRYIPNRGCSARFPPKDFISAMHGTSLSTVSASILKSRTDDRSS